MRMNHRTKRAQADGRLGLVVEPVETQFAGANHWVISLVHGNK